jgi:hypothetical protein
MCVPKSSTLIKSETKEEPKNIYIFLKFETNYSKDAEKF